MRMAGAVVAMAAFFWVAQAGARDFGDDRKLV